MLEWLVLIGMAVVIAELLRRTKALEQRIVMLEGHGEADRRSSALPEASQEPAAPKPAVIVSAPSARVVQRRESPWVAAEVPPEPVAEPVSLDAPPPAPEPVLPPSAVEAIQPIPDRASGFEDLFGRRLPIWAGGITLAVAGVLIVKYSIDAGLLSPLVRVILGLVFGTALIAGAEAALRQEARVQDERVRQALSGAGIATLYSSILIAANLYALVGPVTAFIGMALVTALAMGLSLRFGAPSALLGLAGGLAAPALVGTGEPNVPLLSCYLALTVGGLCAVSRTQRWMWLGVAALAGGMGWGALLILNGAIDFASSLSIGLFVLAIGIFMPIFAFSGGRATLLRIAAAVLAAAQMAALVATGGFAMLHWGLFGLISLALIWLALREPMFARVPPLGLGIALFLLGIWPDPAMDRFALVMGGLALLYGGAALWRLWRADGGIVEAGQVAALALAGLLLPMRHFWDDDSPNGAFAALAAAVALYPAGAAMLGWRKADRLTDARFAMLATVAMALLVASAWFALPDWTVPIAAALGASALLFVSLRAQDMRVERCGLGFAVIALALLIASDAGIAQLGALFGESGSSPVAQAVIRWAVLALVAAHFAWRARMAEGRIVAQCSAALLAYGALAQIAPSAWLSVMTAAALLLLAIASGRLTPHRLLPAMAVLLLVVLGWASVPIVDWGEHALLSLLASPMLARDLPSLSVTMLRLALPAAFLGIALYQIRGRIAGDAPKVAVIIASAMGGIALHILYKQLFALSNPADFVRAGLAERIMWEALLLGAGYALWRTARWPAGAIVLVAAALAHSLWYTLLLHNPIWAGQSVGALPIVNLLIPTFALPLVALWLLPCMLPDWATRLSRPIAIAQMLIVTLFAYASLRQLFHGALLNGTGVEGPEDILRSVLAILLAIGFLLWGIRRARRDWRIASLVLMLGAVAKVFLFDASGLDGLLRIGSFVALGFSLIGLGWLYSRQLKADH